MAVILYVEDHPPAQMLMEAIVTDLTDYQLHLASSGEEACQLTQTISPDLYIVDLDLPDTTGLELIKELIALHSAPVILVSAYAEAADDSILSENVSYYLAKPLDPDYVAEIIRRALA